MVMVGLLYDITCTRNLIKTFMTIFRKVIMYLHMKRLIRT